MRRRVIRRFADFVVGIGGDGGRQFDDDACLYAVTVWVQVGQAGAAGGRLDGKVQQPVHGRIDCYAGQFGADVGRQYLLVSAHRRTVQPERPVRRQRGKSVHW